jgi:hypothetical protein
MESERLLTCSQDPATNSNSEPDESSPRPHILSLKDPFNIIIPSTLRSSKWSLPLRFSDKYCLCISLVLLDLISLVILSAECLIVPQSLEILH